MLEFGLTITAELVVDFYIEINYRSARVLSSTNMKKYGLQLRLHPSQQQKKQPPVPPPLGFRQDDDDNVENEISRQASKNKVLREIEEHHKKALEENPSLFDYDRVYDEMKEKTVRHKLLGREDKKPKFIHKLIQKAEERKREDDIVYEKKLTQERSKEDHLYADKDKFVTSAYKKKLAEQEQWAALRRLRDLQDEKEDVTKKKDLSDFYYNIGKNIAFGGGEIGKKSSDKTDEIRKPEKPEEQRATGSSEEKEERVTAASIRDKDPNAGSEPSRMKDKNQGECSSSRSILKSDPKLVSDRPASEEEKSSVGQPSTDEPNCGYHKRSQDAVTTAKERFLARKRAKEQESLALS